MGSTRYPKWSPDGTRIAFASDRNGSLSIYLMNEDGTNCASGDDIALEGSVPLMVV